MARQPRFFVPDEALHVIQRGNNRVPIFAAEEDYHFSNRGQPALSPVTLRPVPGMQVNAEIHLGTRSVLEYLLSPIQKMAHEAGRER